MKRRTFIQVLSSVFASAAVPFVKPLAAAEIPEYTLAAGLEAFAKQPNFYSYLEAALPRYLAVKRGGVEVLEKLKWEIRPTSDRGVLSALSSYKPKTVEVVTGAFTEEQIKKPADQRANFVRDQYFMISGDTLSLSLGLGAM